MDGLLIYPYKYYQWPKSIPDRPIDSRKVPAE